jgi:hypothetical protein
VFAISIHPCKFGHRGQLRPAASTGNRPILGRSLSANLAWIRGVVRNALVSINSSTCDVSNGIHIHQLSRVVHLESDMQVK